MRKKETQTQADDAAQFTAPAPSTASRMLAPLDIQQKEFRVATRGYKMRDVDEFLDQITDAMSAVLSENERLRAGAPASIGTADLDDTNRQADEIIQRARDEAARLTAEARARAAASAVGSGSGDRSAVNAFLAQEREFLQGLAGLVQGHAETVKGMAKASRRQPASSARAEAPPSETAAAERPTEVTTAAPIPAEARRPAPEDARDEPVVIQDPEPASMARAESDEAPESDSSLRELFWGED